MPITVIDTVEPKNDAFEDIVKMEHVGLDNLEAKETPVVADTLILADSEDSGAKKTMTISQIPAATAGSAGLATAAQITKLDGIEAGADVTDATNVDAAGATMNADTDVSGNGYVLDEDTMSSNDDTKVPTQQSVKAYVDANAGGSSEIYNAMSGWNFYFSLVGMGTP